MSNEKLVEVLRDPAEKFVVALEKDAKRIGGEWETILNTAAQCIRALLQAHADEATALQPQAEEPVEAVGCLSIRRFRGCDSMVNHDFDYFGSLPDGDYRLYTQPQPLAQDAKDAARQKPVGDC